MSESSDNIIGQVLVRPGILVNICEGALTPDVEADWRARNVLRPVPEEKVDA